GQCASVPKRQSSSDHSFRADRAPLAHHVDPFVVTLKSMPVSGVSGSGGGLPTGPPTPGGGSYSGRSGTVGPTPPCTAPSVHTANVLAPSPRYRPRPVGSPIGRAWPPVSHRVLAA